jgi:glycosyltransferase involved in cell wall biosynthesis
MVGTIEPRKGYAQILESFEILWHEGVQISLLIIGKQGWMVEDLVEKIKTHPLLYKQLFWFPRVSDEDLQTAYRQSTCLIAGSFGEGFGLPLIEAAHFQLPILARDIDVFREVAGTCAEFCVGSSPEMWATAIKGWLQKYQIKKHVKSTNLKYFSWSESVKYLKKILEKKVHQNAK